MKRIVASAVILGIMVMASAAFVWKVRGAADALLGQLDAAQSSFERGDLEGSAETAREAVRDWDRLTALCIFTVDMGQAGEISAALAEILTRAEEGSQELRTACRRAQTQLKLFRDTQTPTLWRIL